MSRRSGFLPIALAVLVPLSVAAICHDEESTGDSGAITPESLESFLQDRSDRPAAFFDGLNRLLVALGGGAADGVTITPSGNVVNATVDLDLDLDGTRETSIGGSLTFSSPEFSFADGATLSISSIDSPGFGGSLTASATEIGTATIQFNGSASFPITEGPTVSVPEFGVSVTSFANFILGFAVVEVADLSMDVSFEEDGQGGWQMRVVGSDFEFVI